MKRRDHILAHSNLNFHVTDWGDVKAQPIVMLHGIRGYAETFQDVARALQPDYRVIAYDQRGRGRSDWDPLRSYYTDTYVDDLQAIVDQMGLKKFDLLGHSMGGINAIVYAARYPDRVRKLIIEDAGPGAFEVSEGAKRICKELQETPASFLTWEDAYQFMRRLRPTVSDQAIEQRLKSMLVPRGDGGYVWCYDHAGISATRLNPDKSRVIDLLPLVSKIRCEFLLVRGGRSDYLQADMSSKMLSENNKIEEIVIPDAGHYIHDDQPEKFIAALLGFLEK